MKDRLISLKAAIAVADYTDCTGLAIEDVKRVTDEVVKALKQLPSAQQELPFEIQDILDYLDTVLHPIISPEHWNVYSELHDMISTLPSTQPGIKPINYQDCANAMLRMWMDNVVTDGEYNRIMDKLNAFWRAKDEF